MKTTVLPVLGLVFAGLALGVGAMDRYVAPGGTDSGTGAVTNQPWATLAYAVDAADSADIIHVAAGTYTTEGEIYVHQDLTILGAGVDQTIIQADPAPGVATNRVFRFGSSHVYTLADLTVRHGRLLAGEGGGIRNRGTLTLNRVTVSSNSAAGQGGGIYSELGRLTLERCRILSNTGLQSGGGLETYRCDLMASNTTIGFNQAASSGGGFYNNGGTGVFSCATIYSNSAAYGGGIANEGPLSLINCTISLNSARQDGGGIRNNITNLTLWVRNCTIACNAATNRGGGIDSNQAEPIVLGHTILATNKAASNLDTYGFYRSEDYNLIQNTTGATLSGTNLHNVVGKNPLLGPLQDNGGPSWTHALGTNSPAFNAGGPTFDALPGTDQRGASRVQNGQIDIGAYERLEPDQDGDEMDGQWEFTHGLNPTNNADAAQNPDGDAFISLCEYTADTDPLAADSFWHLDAIVVTGVVAVSYVSSSSRVYDLEWISDLHTGLWAGVVGRTNRAGSGGPFTMTDTNAAARRCYRVKVRVP